MALAMVSLAASTTASLTLPVAMTAATTASIVEGKPLPAGPPIPVVTLKGETRDLRADLDSGGAKLVVFWASWCQPCIHEIPEIRELGHFYGKKGLRVVGVALSWNGDTLEKVSQAVETQGIDYPVLFDNADKARIAFELRAIPASLLIDGQGTVRWRGEVLPSDINARIKEALGPGEERGSR